MILRPDSYMVSFDRWCVLLLYSRVRTVTPLYLITRIAGWEGLTDLLMEENRIRQGNSEDILAVAFYLDIFLHAVRVLRRG